MKNHKLYALSVFVFLFVLIGIAWLMLGSYAQAREDALGQLRFQARMLAGQTARGIQSYILNYHNSLSFLSGLPEIRDALNRKMIIFILSIIDKW